MILKSFSIQNGDFCSDNPLSAQGFVQIKKERQEYSLTIQLNNFSKQTFAFVVCANVVSKIKIRSATTKAMLSHQLDNSTCVFIDDYNLFACKNGTNGCLTAYQKVLQSKVQPKNKNTLEKIFGVVHDTYFFDCIKPKLANLFAVGQSCPELSKYFECSKWASVCSNNQEKVFGIIYKDDFAYAIAVGYKDQHNEFPQAKEYKINNKTYNILFLSASNGKIINF